MNENTLTFDDITRKEIPVRVGTTDYVLREANGTAATRYRNAMFSQAVLGENGKPQSLKDIGNLEPLLVHLCLFEKATGKNVPMQTIMEWPAYVQRKLFAKAKEISRLEDDDEKTETEAKNLPADTQDGLN